ncbi:solute carrier organic anion transporter family member 2A1-like [Ptychodera flava]|uniref:solute carrier organic anion transporter family member 2A1-like n=1 Tax=Ptychodera flava TaxID=63121 RepID=UPI00396A24CD
MFNGDIAENNNRSADRELNFWESKQSDDEEQPGKFPLTIDLEDGTAETHLLYDCSGDVSKGNAEKKDPSVVSSEKPSEREPTGKPGCSQDIRCFVGFAYIFNFNVIWLISVALAVAPTVQVRYGLTTPQLGFIALMGVLGTVLALPFVTYFCGGRTDRRPVWTALGGVFIAVGFTLMLLPQIFDYEYRYDKEAKVGHLRDGQNSELAAGDLCSPVENGDSPYRIISSDLFEECQDEKVPTMVPDDGFAFLCFAAGAVVVGIGYAPVNTLMLSYVDDYGGDNAPFYIGLLESCWGIAPIVGYIFGALSLRLYVDFNRVDMSSIDIGIDDPRWVGAWWLIVAIGSAVVVITAIPLLCFSKSMHKPSPVVEATQLVLRPIVASSDVTKEYWRATVRLLTNGVLVVALFAYSIDRPVGLVMFTAKYLQQLKVLRPLLLNFIIVCVWLFPAVPACIFTGLILKKLRQSLVSVSKMIIILSVTAVVCAWLLLVFPMEGTTVNAPGHGIALSNQDLISTCNANCECSTEHYQPVCGTDKMTYFSPCHAGCSRVDADTGKMYANCSCVVMEPQPPLGVTVSFATDGPCEDQPIKRHLAAFIIFVIIFSLATHGGTVPHMTVVMRSVHRRDKSFALGLHLIFVRIFNYIPGALISGLLINYTCAVWQTTECNTPENCVSFNSSAIHYSFMALGGGASAVALFFYMVLYLLIKRNTQPNYMTEFYEKESKKAERIASYQKIQMITSI